jgi:hypothetical protein
MRSAKSDGTSDGDSERQYCLSSVASVCGLVTASRSCVALVTE